MRNNRMRRIVLGLMMFGVSYSTHSQIQNVKSDIDFSSLKKLNDPVGSSLTLKSSSSNTFIGTLYTSQFDYKPLLSQVEQNLKAQDHCSKIKCFKPTDKAPRDLIGPYGEFSVDSGETKDLYMTLSSDLYANEDLKDKVGEIVNVYRMAFDGWPKDCSSTLLIPPSKFLDYDGTRIAVDVDTAGNGWMSTVLCHQYFYDGEKYTPIDVTGEQVLVYKGDNDVFLRLDVEEIPPAFMRITPQFYFYDIQTNGAYVSLYSDFRRDAYFEKHSGKYEYPNLNTEQLEDDPKKMILDFLEKGHSSRYAKALMNFFPIQVYYEQHSDSIVYLLNYTIPEVNFVFDEKLFTQNPNCNIYKSYHGSYLSPEGLYYCLYEVEDGWKRIRIARDEVLSIPRSPLTPMLSGRTLAIEKDGTFEVYKQLATSVSTHVSGKVYPQPSPDFFRKMRTGYEFSAEEMPDEGFESCVKERDGKKMSCSFFEITDPVGC